ncbi:MAG TPA: FtsX-like permease family protein [Dinghuibacter sp.]|uniref:ABC transporter permease n=1 Tax=Dinghuibacter sp. TaxID=2024697 RepID=UPI002C439765|nr:FtsX-like permease family protein [Dinghuibacter sp.]HTJ11485.1 FtsX-like permease family protein [Dinghuibacter sp.]
MFKNYLLVAARNLQRHKILSAIHVLGLAISISASLVIFLIVRYSYGFDRFEPDAGRLYRVVSDYSSQNGSGHTRGTQAPMSEVVQKELAGTDLVTVFRYYSPNKQSIQLPGEKKPAKFPAQRKIIFTNPAYFQMLHFTWLAGSPEAIQQPGRVVLDETRAQLYFPGKSYDQVVGSSIVYDDSITAQVSGIVRDLDKQGSTDFSFHEFISLATLLDNQGLRRHFFWDDWGGTTSDQQLFVRLSKGSTRDAINARLHYLGEKYIGDDERKYHYSWKFLLQPLSDVHFNKDYGILDSPVSDKNMLNGMMAIAVFLLALACINFINLTTAQATVRAREIGIRKTMGSSRLQLVSQFLSETFLVTSVSAVLSLLLLRWLVKAFSDYMPQGFHFTFTDPSLFLFVALLVVAVTLLSGTYPALVLSSWNAAVVMKNQGVSSNTRKAWMRKTLTVSQFVIAQFFIMGTLVVSKQIRYMLDSDLGFRKEAVLSFSIPGGDTSVSRRLALLNEVKQLPAVEMASLASDVTNSGGWWHKEINYKDGKKDLQIPVELKAGDVNFLKLFHIPLIAGREPLPSDTVIDIVINETYMHALGFQKPEDAIGKVTLWDGKRVPIAGVMKNFYAHSLDHAIEPMAFFHSLSDSRTMIVALPPRGRWKETIDRMGTAFKSLYPDDTFDYNFLDDSINNSYGEEKRIERLIAWSAGLTIFISCLGLLGLVMYTTNQRTREIGIRKVLGASIRQIVSLLSRDFMALVGLAFVIATPLAWWANHAWLQHYAYRIALSWWLFPLCGLAMTLIALLTISYQTIRAAAANPVDNLRTE